MRGDVAFGRIVFGLIVAAFGIIQGLLTLRMVLPYIQVPEQLQPLTPLLIDVTNLLMAPFSGFSIPGGGFPGLGSAQLDTTVLPALIGWSIVELVILGALRLFGAGRHRSGPRQDWEA